MKKLIIIIIVLIILISIYFLIFRKGGVDIKNYPSGGSTIVAFGDSLTQGVGASKGSDLPSLLSVRIGEPIINMGISGNTSADGLARVEEVIAQDPKIVIVLFGGNDFLRKVPIDETFSNIENIVSRVQDSGAVVVLVGIRGGALSDPYQERFEDIAKRRGALYVPDIMSSIIINRNLMSDAIHPNNTGYQKIADKIYPVLKKAL